MKLSLEKDTLTSTDSVWHELFYYDESSPSCLRRKTDWLSGEHYKTVKAVTGDTAGGLCKNGGALYYRLSTGGKNVLCHRIVWEIHHGKIEDGVHIDHINGDSLDNKITNLRCADNKTNCRNRKISAVNKSSVTGVCLSNRGASPRWVAQYMTLDGKVRSKSFAVNKYGDNEAFRLACEYRERMIAELNAQGAGYTHDHGKR